METITSESQIIDKQAVQAACNEMSKAAEDFISASKKVADGKGYAGADAMSVEGKTMEDNFDAVKDTLKNVYDNINAFINSVLSSTNNVYNRQCELLREYRAELAEAKKSQK